MRQLLDKRLTGSGELPTVTPDAFMSCLPAVKFWLWLSALASLAGWGLSAIGQLNGSGYIILLGTLAVGWGMRLATKAGQGSVRRGAGPAVKSCWRRWRRRFGRGLPLSFAVLAGMVFLGGALYPPTSHTAFTYRIPRALHWLAEGRWHWIHTIGYRMNDRACGMEWLEAPLLLLTRSDRALFLLNFIPFLLLPGLVFSVLWRLGVRARVAWAWMWLLPTGYTFLLQGGSAGNDAFPTVYALAALDFACRAWANRRPGDLCLSVVAAALLTGAKASNLPLLLPWAAVMAACLPIIKRHWPRLLAVSPVAALVSFLPTAGLNLVYCGDWSGLSLERSGMDLKNPWVGIWGNGLLFLKDNLVPPFFPAAGWWNDSVLSRLPRGIVGPLAANFENGFHQVKELPTEDWAGLGFGLSLLLAASVVAAPRIRGGNRGLTSGRSGKEGAISGSGAFSCSAGQWRIGGDRPLRGVLRWCAVFGAWGALGVFCVKSGMTNGARLISPYYPLMLPLLLAGAGQAELVRRRWWRALAGGVVGLASIVLVVTPGRPLWPAQTVLSRALGLPSGGRLVARALKVYAVYAGRSDPLAAVRALLPADLQVVGFMADGDDIDISLWRPYFQRRVLHVLLSDSAAELRRRGLRYVVVGGAYLGSQHTSFEEWRQRVGAELVGAATATLKVAEGPQSWYLARVPAVFN